MVTCCLNILFSYVVLLNVVKADDPKWELLQQSDYDVKLEIVKVASFNRSYFSYAKIDAVPYNRTFRVINGTFVLLVDLSNHLTVNVHVYKFASNEYRDFPINFNFDACAEYNHDSFGIKVMLNKFTNIRPCHLKKGVYHVRNLLINFGKYPPFIPRGRYRKDTNFLESGGNILTFHNYIEIKDKPWN